MRFPSGYSWTPYALALSLSGVRPGVLLPDGRRLPLNVDALTHAVLFGGLGHFLSFASVGRLGPLGLAFTYLDVSRLPGVSGIRVWAVAVALDPAAPLGLGTISDPILIVL
jgi:hypothetical protein